MPHLPSCLVFCLLAGNAGWIVGNICCLKCVMGYFIDVVVGAFASQCVDRGFIPLLSQDLTLSIKFFSALGQNLS